MERGGNMKVIFFGTSGYCLPVLDALKKNFDLKLVITRPDAPVGRKKTLTPSATKLWAKQRNATVITPATLKKDTLNRASLSNQLLIIHPDLAVVSDYGLIIPQGLFNIPKLGTLNIHFSKLPELRGTSPVQHTLLRGDTTAWVTIFKLENPPELEIKMDSGPILWQKEYPIDPNDTTETLYTRLFQNTAKELPKIISDFASGSTIPQPQDQSKATYTKPLTRQDGFVEWKDIEKPETYNKFRASYPWPGLWTLRQAQGKLQRMKILKCHLEKEKLVLDEVQFEGKKPQPASQGLPL